MVMVVGVIAVVDRRFGRSDSCDYIRMAVEMRHLRKEVNKMRRMTNEEAIEVLDDMKVKVEIPKAAVTQYKKNVALDMAIKALEAQDVARERYEDLCEYFNNNPHTIELILNDRKEFKAWLERLHWHVLECDKLARKLEALECKDTDVPSRKGVFIPDITVEMLRNASLEGVEDLMTSGEMEDILLPPAQPTEASCWGCNCPKMERLKEQKTFSEMVHLHDAETHDKRTETHACDCISRKAAIDAAISADMENNSGILSEKRARVIKSHINTVQPADVQPVVHCKDCKWRMVSMDCTPFCSNDKSPVYAITDYFGCIYGKRKGIDT